MTGRRKPELSAKRARELIAEVDASDRQQARRAIAGAVQEIQDQWIAAPVIAEALVLELTTVVQSNRLGSEAAAYLRTLARALEAQGRVH